jgi:hypothetical protein
MSFRSAKISQTLCQVGFLVLLMILATPGLSSATVRTNLTIVAINGQTAPGTSGATFSAFSTPCVINNQSQVAFKARLNWVNGSIDPSNDDGIWTGTPGQLQLVAREKDPVPGTEPGTTVASFSTLRLANDGFIAFAATLQGPSIGDTNDTCFMAGYPGAITLVAREGAQMPGGAAGEAYASLGSLAAYPYVCGRAGEVLWRGNVSNAATNSGTSAIWGGAPGAIKLLAREDAPVPGWPGVQFGALWTTDPRLNPLGKFAFNTTLSGSGISLANNSVLCTGTTQTVAVALQEGAAVSAIPGATFNSFANASVNTSNQLCFIGKFNTGAVTNDTAILTGPPEQLAVIAREGSQVPAFDSGVVFKDLWLVEPVWNESGLVAFVAKISGPGINSTNDVGVWVANTNVTHLLCRPLDPAPGCPLGVVFHHAFSGTFDIPVMNSAGNIAFSSKIEGPGIGLTNDDALFVGPPAFVQLLLQDGDQIRVGSNDLRTMFAFHMVDGSAGSQPSGGQDGRSRCLNDKNQLLFAVTFQAGQGSALCLVNDVTDPNGTGLPYMVQRALGVTAGGDAGQVLPRYLLTNDQLYVTYGQATNEPYLDMLIENAGALGGGLWQQLPLTNQIVTTPSNLPPNVELHTLPIQPATNSMQFFRASVRSLLWEKQ